MAFRERIEAVLKIKDANRFKAGMATAAKAVRKFGHDEEAAAAQTELLQSIEEKLERQSIELTAATRLLASAVDDLGDEMVQTAAKSQALNAVTKKSGSNAVFLGKSWAFWKDRLSLTRSEILTTSITIGVYFLPAIIAMGSSFANAALGGGAVAAGGLSSLLFGLGALATLISPLKDDIDKITKAQDQYNLAVEQYGAASSQASRASAHLGAIIRTQGGKDALKAVTAVERLKKTWASMTKPGQKSIIDILLGGTGALRSVMPSMAGMTNSMAASLSAALQPLFRAFSGPEFQKGFGALTRIFNKSIGPGIKGVTNIATVFFRIIRASAPFVIKWAKAWERTTQSWSDSTSDQKKVSAFLKSAVGSFKLWWGLAKELGRTFKIIFGSSKDEGDQVVGVLTNLVRKFNDWLQIASSTGRIDAFWKRYNQSVTDAVWALRNPVEAINKWLPVVMDTIATTLATHAPHAANLFIKAFLNSGGWAQFLTTAWIIKRMGGFKLAGKLVGAMFLTPFIEAFVPGFTSAVGLSSLSTGRIGAAMGTAGNVSGKLFGVAFVLAATAALATWAPDIEKWIRERLGIANPEADKQPDESTWSWFWRFGRPEGHTPIDTIKKPFDKLLHPSWDPNPFKAAGGTIGPGMSAFVGEMGPEIATSTKGGTKVRPLGRNGPGMIDMPSLEDMMHLNIETSVQIDRREIARAYNTEQAFVTARRGGRPPRTQVW